jgi:hypothetical protein
MAVYERRLNFLRKKIVHVVDRENIAQFLGIRVKQ